MGLPAHFLKEVSMRTALAFVALLVCSVAYADPCTCQQKASTGNPCLCIFGCECVKTKKPKPPPINVNVPPACACQVGDACGCPPGHCHCASAQWFETPGTNGDQFGLFKGSKQVGSYRRSDGVFLPLLGDSWGKPCKCPKTPPGRASGTIAPRQTYQPQSFFPQIRSGGRSGSC